MGENNDLIFKIEDLHKKYVDNNNEHIVFKGINLEIKRNEKVGIVSPSGSGKTTLLNMLAAIDSFDDGNITYYPKNSKPISYKDIKNKDVIRKKYFGFIFQTPYMLKSFNVLENVTIPLIIQKEEEKIREKKAKNILRILFKEGYKGEKKIKEILKEKINFNNNITKEDIIKLIDFISNGKIQLSLNEIKSFEIDTQEESILINEIYIKTNFKEYIILNYKDTLKLFINNFSNSFIFNKIKSFIPFINRKKKEYSLFKKSTNLLSGGELQRVAIARAIIHNPDVIFADEPTGNLDKENALNVLNLIRDICDEYKSTLILVTHSEEYARKYCNRILKIENKQKIVEMEKEICKE